MPFVALILPVPGYEPPSKSKSRAGREGEEGAPPPNNTGEYGGWNIRVKGDGRVEAIDPATGIATMHHDVIEAKHSIDTNGVPGGGGEVDPGPEPEELTLTSLEPASGEVGVGISITLTGTGFTEFSTVKVDGNLISSDYVSETELSSFFPGAINPVTVSVTVEDGGEVSNAVSFEIV